VNPLDLVGATRDELAALARDRGQRFDPAALAGRRYDGISLGLPRIVEKLTWIKFAKQFRREPGGAIRGWNVRIEQDGLDRPWRPRRRRDGGDAIFGWFDVVSRDGDVVLDYSCGNRRFDPIRMVRDPVVAIDGTDVLLGWSTLAIGRTTIPTPSWFVLADRR
jgi:hypothetical protein